MITPVTKTDKKENITSVNFNSFLPGGKDMKVPLDGNPQSESVLEKEVSRQKVKNSSIVKSKKNEELPMVQSNVPYEKTYDETNNMLKGAIVQIDELAGAVRSDIESVRSSKTFKGKYNVLPNMTGSMASLISSKITAIREINNSITQSHNLDFKRYKEINAASANGMSDDKTVMDTYNAFISLAGGNTAALGYTDAQVTNMHNYANKPISFVNNGAPTQNVSMSPEFSSVYGNMKYESDPNVQTVVVFNQTTGAMYFDVMNISTGQSIPGIEKPDPMFLDDVTLDIPNRLARNTNLAQTYTLILVGDNIGHY